MSLNPIEDQGKKKSNQFHRDEEKWSAETF